VARDYSNLASHEGGTVLDTDEDSEKLSRHFVRKGMANLSEWELFDLLTADDPIVRTAAGMLLHLSEARRDINH
jgi:hypothetical protein